MSVIGLHAVRDELTGAYETNPKNAFLALFDLLAGPTS